jgi:predicted O-linked N-acetylglucosamine transferase (SPINDLY family)
MPEVHFNCGIAYFELREFSKSIESYQLAINFRPNYSDAYRNLGAVYSELNNHKAASDSFLEAISIDPQFAEAYFLLGKAQQELKFLDEAIKNYSKALELNPNLPFGLGYVLHAKMLACDWNNLDVLSEKIVDGISKSKEVAEPFGFQAISESESDLLACAKLFFANRHQNLINKNDANINKLTIERSNSKIRIGYVGGEFRKQATTILLAGVWERHDKDKFEIYAFDNGWGDASVWRSRVEASFDEIIDINNFSDLDVAKMIRERHIDILINLNGYFGRSRNGVFKIKPAPLQVNFLGFPGTLGDECMDYIVADDCVLPVSSQNFYCEKVVYMPETYQPNDRSRKISDSLCTRNELGLPDDGFVYCCFNNNYKITSRIFESWMRILNQVNGSVLWLLEDNPSASRNLRASARSLGIDPDRLIFAERVELSVHLSRQRCANLFLDTVPYNAHTTASDALWVGLPILTIKGNTFPGRVSASLLNSLRLNELVVENFEDYESAAMELALNKEKLLTINKKLKNNIESFYLFDADHYVKKFEDALIQIQNRFVNGLGSDHIFVV